MCHHSVLFERPSNFKNSNLSQSSSNFESQIWTSIYHFFPKQNTFYLIVFNTHISIFTNFILFCLLEWRNSFGQTYRYSQIKSRFKLLRPVKIFLYSTCLTKLFIKSDCVGKEPRACKTNFSFERSKYSTTLSKRPKEWKVYFNKSLLTNTTVRKTDVFF